MGNASSLLMTYLFEKYHLMLHQFYIVPVAYSVDDNQFLNESNLNDYPVIFVDLVNDIELLFVSALFA